ncbi:pentapeptide repeat-containing protein [Actinosynnema sp. NPDC050801]|uniref:pentapeptide repeat-containing protein n=1 Tax=unclassified Actinosynnema TaxID=2637065 RepID=UPI0033F7FC6B
MNGPVNPKHWPGDHDLDLTGAMLIDLDLSGCSIRDATFNGASFLGDAHFRFVEFTRQTTFDRARFESRALFQDARFRQTGSFLGTVFVGAAMFDKVRFVNSAWFFDAEFTDQASFGEASFHGQVGFHRTRFADVTFESARMAMPGEFVELRCTGDAVFSRVHFASGATFTAAEFGGTVVMSGALARVDDEDGFRREVEAWPPGWKTAGIADKYAPPGGRWERLVPED